jgi:signal transduction histidine kinase/ActR/RegA family two-component response regulator
MDFAKMAPLAAEGLLDALLADESAIMTSAAVPIPEIRPMLEANLKISQYRQFVEDYVNDPQTFMLYPVFNSFSSDRVVGGVLAINLYWKYLLSDLIPPGMNGIICIVENSYNQTLAYEINGPRATYLGTWEAINHTEFEDLEFSVDLTTFHERTAGPRNTAYKTLGLHHQVGQYSIRIFPSHSTQAGFRTHDTIIYTVGVVCIFAFTSLVFFVYSVEVDKRHKMMTQTAIRSLRKAAEDERDLNEFLSHELRNPLAAAVSACSIVAAEMGNPGPLNEEQKRAVLQDVEVASSSLNFVNEFLTTMLDLHKVGDAGFELNLEPTDIYCALESVSSLLNARDAAYEVNVDCPKGLIAMTDTLRFKQIVLNLVSDCCKYTKRGFVRMRTATVNGLVRVYIEDSGPGIDKQKRHLLFSKKHTSLDTCSQGSGPSLCLSKKLMLAMNGNIWLDESYDSGIEYFPGTRFVLELNKPPLRVCEETSREISLAAGDIESGCINTDGISTFSYSENAIQFGTAKCESDLNHDKRREFPLNEVLCHETPANLSILFVDDDSMLRKLFIRAVLKLGPDWLVSGASSGEEAMRVCQSESFDLIFLDQYMVSAEKGLSGTETASLLRERGVTSIICGLSANNLKTEFLAAGADNFLLKPMPCKAAELKLTLHRILKERLVGNNSIASADAFELLQDMNTTS